MLRYSSRKVTLFTFFYLFHLFSGGTDQIKARWDSQQAKDHADFRGATGFSGISTSGASGVSKKKGRGVSPQNGLGGAKKTTAFRHEFSGPGYISGASQFLFFAASFSPGAPFDE
jgi:hypothetical protein